MFWNKKETKDGLPDLPPLKTSMRPGFELPEIDEDERTSPQGLPSFPDSPLQKGFSQAAIKDAIDENSEEMPEEHPQEQFQKIKTMEMEEWAPASESSILEEPPEHSIINSTPERRGERKSAGTEVFVKIDKFNSARRSLDSIKQKLDDMDILLKKVRDTKMREEQELSGWERELTAIKGRIQDVNSNIFD